MRYLRYIPLLLLFAQIFTACESEPEKITIDREIQLEQQTPAPISSDRPYVRVAAETTEASFSITSEHGWKVLETHEDWLSIEPTSSQGGGKVTVTVTMTPNETYTNRSAKFLFYSDEDETEVSLVQAGIPAPEFCCDFSTSQNIVFNPEDVTATDVTITTYNEAVTVSAEGLDTFCSNYPAEIEAGKQVTISLCPPSANIYDTRQATVTFTGKESNKTRTLTVEQKNLYKAVHGFPAKWEIMSSTYRTTNEGGKLWINNGISYALQGNGAGSAIISAVSSDSGRKLKFSLSSSNTLAISNMTTDDYIIFCVPVLSVAAGCDFDFLLSLTAGSDKSPKYWIFEYFDGGEWKSVEQDLKVVPEDGVTKYSFYTKLFDSSNYTSFMQSFTLQNPMENDFVKVRCRVVSRVNSEGKTLQANEAASVIFPRFTFMSCYLHCYNEAPAIKDTHKIMALGNSFTYYYATPWMLKEIARHEGHQLRFRANIKGSQSFDDHLALELSKYVVNEGGYDYALLQDSSYGAADFYRDGCKESDIRIGNTKTLSSRVRQSSANAKIILEHTWAYPKDGNYRGYGDYNNFADHLYNGAVALWSMAPEVDWLSPIGVAFRKAHDEGHSLLYTDNFHQNRNGAYLKSCVNYLMIFGEKFGPNPTNCGVDPAIAKRFREIAEEVVLGNESKYKK